MPLDGSRPLHQERKSKRTSALANRAPLKILLTMIIQVGWTIEFFSPMIESSRCRQSLGAFV
jgi:hypothetical protein